MNASSMMESSVDGETIPEDFSQAFAHELEILAEEASARKLNETVKWAAEFLLSLPASEVQTTSAPLPTALQRRLRLVYALIDAQEFQRAAAVSKVWSSGVRDSIHSFLHFYARYLAAEKERLDAQAEVLDKAQAAPVPDLRRLYEDLESLREEEDPVWDPYHLYLLALVAKARGDRGKSLRLSLAAIQARPSLWPAWELLCSVLDSREALEALDLPAAPVFHELFQVEANLRLGRPEEAVSVTERMGSAAVLDSDWMTARLASARHKLQDCQGARELFGQLHERSPQRLEAMDDYANTLFVLAESVETARVELIALAKATAKVDRFAPVTCSVLANYHALRGEHEKAIQWHQRAAKLDPDNALGSFVLMGHEFMELKNTPAAVLAYRKALELNPMDARAWYAMGHAYDLLQMPSYAQHYYLKAHAASPADSRFLIALGDMLAEKGAHADARAAFWRAHSVGDPDGKALFKLATAYEQDPQAPSNAPAKAAAAYWHFLKAAPHPAPNQATASSEQAQAFLALAQHALDEGAYGAALSYAHSAAHFPLSKSRAKQILSRASEAQRRQQTRNPVKTE